MQNNGKLYFGTNARRLQEIQDHGLLPLNGSMAVPLTLAFGLFYAVQKAKAKHDRAGLIVEIDLHKLNPYKLVPSADFMEQLTRSDPQFDEVHAKLPSQNARIRWFAARIDRFAKHTGQSIALIGNCGYVGPIPRDACTRFAVIDLHSPIARRLLGRPAVSPLGYSLMGKYYLQVTRFAFGDQISYEGLHPRLVSVLQEVKRDGVRVL